VQQVDPPVQIDPSVWATYEAAHVQAEAAIRAAEIGAQAAWDAAMLQISAAIIAAVAALIAGRWAYRAAIKAAERQTQLENHKHNTRVKAYSIRQEALLNIIIKDLVWETTTTSLKIKYFDKVKDKSGKFIFKMPITKEPEEWKNEQWENHAILGNLFVKKLIAAKGKLNILNKNKEYIISNSTNITKDRYETEDIFTDFPIRGVVKRIKSFDVLHSFKKYHSSLLEFRTSVKDLRKVILNITYHEKF
jgi:hypothetical protein